MKTEPEEHHHRMDSCEVCLGLIALRERLRAEVESRAHGGGGEEVRR